MLETLRTLSQLKPYLTTSNPSLSLSTAATTADHHHRRPPPPPTYPLFSLSPPPPPTYPLFSLPPPPLPTATTSDLSSLLSAAAATTTTDTYRCGFSLPGVALRAKGLNRIGNLLVPDDNYCKFEDWIIPIFDQMLEEQSTKVF